MTLPPELEKLVNVVEMPLPDREDLRISLHSVCVDAGSTPKDIVKCEEDHLLGAAAGMTEVEAENAFATMMVRYNGCLKDPAIQDIAGEKAQVIKKSGLLEVISPEGYDLNQVGGLDLLKAWLVDRKRSFTDIAAAEKFGLPAPKGVLFVGVPGAGKSLAAKSVAASWGLPLLRFDPGRVFASLVGQSEQRIRTVCGLAEAIAPAVLWIDEIEKGLAGLQSSGVTDSGVTARVFGTLLTWMQENDKPVFVIGTANDIANLPPALIRRFDEVFRVDVPTAVEREEIIRIHIEKPRREHPGRKVSDFDLKELVASSKGLTGAEIEKAYLAALNAAFIKNREITTADFKDGLVKITPVTKTMEAQVKAMREWAESNARPSSSDVEAKEEEEGGVGFDKLKKRNIKTTDPETEGEEE